jgi:2-haloacid dehalogenase
LLDRAGLRDFVEAVVSIDEVRHWKPRREVYLHAARALGVTPGDLALVAAHAWDVCGAARAGLVTAWVSRKELLFHPAMPPATVTGASLLDAVRALTSLRA